MMRWLLFVTNLLSNNTQIKTAQDISTLVRDLQELWLFGGLDTLSDPADEEANRKKALAVAEMIEALAKQSPAGARQNGAEATNGEGVHEDGA